MKRFLAIGLLVLILMAFPCPGPCSDVPEGRYLENDTLLKEYGINVSEALKRNPSLLGVIEQAKPDFKPIDVGTSFPTEVFQDKDGKKFLIFSGCTPKNCGGTENVIVFDPAENRAWVLIEDRNHPDGCVKYGNPPENIRKLLVYQANNKNQ